MSDKVYNIRRLLAHTNVSSSLVRELLYEDDCDIVTHSERGMQHFMNHFTHACKAFGLEINLKKTVVMHDLVPGLPYIEPAIYIEGKKLVVVHSFLYLSSTSAERLVLTICLRIVKVSGSFLGLEKRIQSQHESNSKQRS